MTNWDHYFHFPAGTNFYIDGPYGYNGAGKVTELTPTRLCIRMDLDAWGPAPALHATVTVEYRQEGAGNTVIVERDGTPATRDDNATIHSNDSNRERAISSRDITCSVGYDGTNEIDFDVYINGDSWDFDFER